MRRALEVICRGKRMWLNPTIARRVADQETQKYATPLYCYKCPVCHGWHLTRVLQTH